MSRKQKRAVSQVAVQNAVKTLVANIRFASVDNPISTMVVTSSIPNEGKTFLSIQLSQALASSGKSVLLVECDMHKCSLAGNLGVHGRHGIYDVLSGEATLDEAAVPAKTPNLFFLDCEPNIPNPTDILSSKRFRELIQAARDAFDYVVMDTPPLGAFVDAAILAAIADATLLVVRQNFVRKDDLMAAFTQLKQADANIVGPILNCCDVESGGYGYGYYGYYGHYGESAKKQTSRNRAVEAKDQTPPLQLPRAA